MVEGHDSGVASAIAFAIVDSANSVVKVTENTSGDWCIFRAQNDINLETFVPAAARCQKCFVGE